MPKLYDQEDLAKLKDSKPVPIIAHSHEVIVPVVYSSMVNHFLEKKGIHLPLTHHQLADMKREAGCPGYAKGTHDLTVTTTVKVKGGHHAPEKAKKSRKKTRGKKKAVEVRGLGVAPAPRPVSRTQLLYNNLRPDNFSMIRPQSNQLPQVFQTRDYKKEAEENDKKLKEALERLKLEHRPNQEQIFKEHEIEWVKQHAPLRMDQSQIPLRESEDILPPVAPKKSEVVIEEEESVISSRSKPKHDEEKYMEQAERDAQKRAEEMVKSHEKQKAKENMPLKDWLGEKSNSQLIEITRKLNRELQNIGMEDLIIRNVQRIRREELLRTLMIPTYSEIILEEIKNQ